MAQPPVHTAAATQARPWQISSPEAPLRQFRQQHQLTAKLLQEVRSIGTSAVQEVLKKLDRAIIDFIREKIDMAIRKGEIRQCDSEITAFLMLKAYIALIVDWEKDHEPLSKEKIAELFELYFLKGLSN